MFQGKEYDSSSETEIRLEQARISSLMSQWESASQTSSLCNYPSPPTPSKRKMGFQDRQNSKQGSQSIAPDKPRSPDIRRCIKGQMSPPTRRCQPPYQQDVVDKPFDQTNRSASPVVVTQQQMWKPNVFPTKLPSQKSLEDDSRSYSPGHLTQREIHQSYGVTSETYMDRESSQITYNPTFQSHSPAHKPQVPQPYIAQIITYPMSQQAVAYHNAQKYITQPGITYQQQPAIQRYPGRAQPDNNPQAVQPNIYYIAPTAMMPTPQMPEPAQILTPKQQTALHLQQYVAMKQAQQAMAFGTQRMPADFGNYCAGSAESPASFARKMYERQEEGYSLNYNMTLGRTPNMPKIVPGQSLRQPVPIVPNVQRVSGFQNRPGCTASLGRNFQKTGDQSASVNLQSMQSSQMQSVPVNSRSSVSITGVQKTVGQIVPMGGQDLVIYQNVDDNFFADQPSGGQSGEVKQKQHLGSNIVGRQMYYSQVVSSQTPVDSGDNGAVWKLQGNSMDNSGSQEYL